MGIGTKSKVPWKLRRYILLSVDDDNFTLVSFLVSGSCAKTLAMQQGDRIFIQNGGTRHSPDPCCFSNMTINLNPVRCLQVSERLMNDTSFATRWSCSMVLNNKAVT